MDYMNDSGKIYIEGSNFGEDHHTTQFFDYFGSLYDNNTTADVGNVTGVNGSIISDLGFDFSDGADENYSVDEISKLQGYNLLYSTGDYMRGVYYEDISGYKTIATTTVLGGFVNGLATRTELMEAYLSFLLDDVNSVNYPPELQHSTLISNAPNPFSNSTNINFYIHSPSQTTITIYNIKGEKIKTVLKENLNTGNHSISWNGRNSHDNKVKSGIYFYNLKINDYSETKKMILQK